MSSSNGNQQNGAKQNGHNQENGTQQIANHQENGTKKRKTSQDSGSEEDQKKEAAEEMNSCREQAQEMGHKDEDVQGEHNEWKFRAPYKIHDVEGGKFKVFYEGGCHCGRVQYQLGREKPLASKLCHCKTCQVLHGAMFQWAAIFHKEDINFIRGHHDLVWYESSEKTIRHKLPCKVSCGYCRAPIMDEGRNMVLLFPGLLRFGEGEEGEARRRCFDVECHMFYGNRLIDIPDGKPKWTGINDKSEQMDLP